MLKKILSFAVTLLRDVTRMTGTSVTELIKARFPEGSLKGGPISLYNLFVLTLDATWGAEAKIKLFVFNSVHAFIKLLAGEDLSVAGFFIASSMAMALETVKIGYDMWNRVREVRDERMSALSYVAHLGKWDPANLMTWALSSQLGVVAIAYDSVWTYRRGGREPFVRQVRLIRKGRDNTDHGAEIVLVILEQMDKIAEKSMSKEKGKLAGARAAIDDERKKVTAGVQRRMENTENGVRSPEFSSDMGLEIPRIFRSSDSDALALINQLKFPDPISPVVKQQLRAKTRKRVFAGATQKTNADETLWSDSSEANDSGSDDDSPPSPNNVPAAKPMEPVRSPEPPAQADLGFSGPVYFSESDDSDLDDPIVDPPPQPARKTTPKKEKKQKNDDPPAATRSTQQTPPTTEGPRRSGRNRAKPDVFKPT